ncbi:MAG: PD-(D/E)XK nuclease family protein, partial [Candidatus Binataceae bacterium]
PAALRNLGARENTLATMLDAYDSELSAAGLADRADIIKSVTKALESAAIAPRFAGIPLVLLDVPIQTAAERELVQALARRAPLVLATVPAGDDITVAMLEQALSIRAAGHPAIDASSGSLIRLQDNLFADIAPPPSDLDESVMIVSAGGEVRECVEIARLIQARAATGVPYDRIAVLLHTVRYAPYLKEALDRAKIPAWFALGSALPEPGGRALLALLGCAADALSARRFGEYLSLAQLPNPQHSEKDGNAGFIAPDAEILAASLRSDLELPPAPPGPEALESDPTPVIEGTLRAPWRWERLLVDAAVIGGRDRWRRRLDGLAAELSHRRGEVDDDDPRAAAIDRRILDLTHLRGAALPLIDELGALPKAALWSEWLARLRRLTAIAIRDSAPVLAALAELEPMAPVGPIGLDEVRLALADRLGRLEQAPSRRRYGAVFVAPAGYARGLEFDTIIVPGLTERVFPRKLIEDPILPDSVRITLDKNLITQSERAAAERLELRIVAGAAAKRIIFTFPRVDLAQGRPRVPSFYALEVLRAAEGRLPDFDELARRAATDHGSRLGWPAPRDPDEAIDDAEFDLAILDKLVDGDPAANAGAAHYLLDANTHLARALRSRARRWLKRWTPADGLVDPSAAALAALHRHKLSARSYSPTALQNFS